MRAGDDVHTDEFADATGRSSTGIGRRLYSRNISANDRRNESGPDLLVPDKLHIRRFYHRIGRLDHRNETLCLDHS